MRFKEFNTQQIPTVGRRDFSKLPPSVLKATQDANKIATQKATQGTNPAVASNPNQKIGQQPSLSQKPTGQTTPINPTIPKDIILPTGDELAPYKIDSKGNDMILTPVNKTPGSNKTVSVKVPKQEILSTLAALQGNKKV